MTNTKLKIIEELTSELTQNGIVICTYTDSVTKNDVNCIDLQYEEEYPFLEKINVLEYNENQDG
jgi:uncharacterized protein (DUF302 family)